MTRNNNILPILLALLFGLCLLLAFVGCKTLPQPTNTHSKDSVRVEYRHDSIYVYQHDSVFCDRWRDGDTVYVSARSIGDINVQLIMEKLGGGGNASAAAVQFNEEDLPGAVNRVYSAIDEYLS